MRRRLLVARGSGLIVAVACFPATAQIFKCPVGDGFAFQQAPCHGLGESGGRLLVFANGKAAPVAVPASASDVPRNGRVLGRTPLPTTSLDRPPK